MNNKKVSFYKNQNFYNIRDQCLRNRVIFCDEYFTCNVPDTQLLRPREICRDPRFFVEEASRFDVIQGQIGNCWLVVAMANLTLNKTMFHHVVPKDQSFGENYAGIFHFRIWQCGEWLDIVVDDLLPTRNNKLIYIHSAQKNEYWSALLEKAYAKLYGSYDQLDGGWFCESMIDFTGGFVERISLELSSKDLDKILVNSKSKGSFMCVAFNGDLLSNEEVTKHGLVPGHAYSVTKVQYVSSGNSSQNTLLVRLRNPWGKIEWSGAWSDTSSEWRSIPEEEKKNMGLVSENEGEFWMSLDDFRANFHYVDICHLGPDLFGNMTSSEAKIGWESNYFKGEWIKEVNAGGLSLDSFSINPQFRITLADTDSDDDTLCTMIIALMQKNKTRRVWHRIGFTVFKLENPADLPNLLTEEYLRNNFSKAWSSTFKHTREVVVRKKWEPGVYCILPSTQTPDQQGKFLLRVFTEKSAIMEETDSNALTSNSSYFPPSAPTIQKEKQLVYRSDKEIKSLFSRVAGKSGEIGWQGLQALLHYALSKDRFAAPMVSSDKFSKYECRVLIGMLDDDGSGRLSFNEFQTLWGKIRQWESGFLRYSHDGEFINTSVLKQALASAGYRVSTLALGGMLRRYADDQGKIAFDDFVMCAIELQTS